MSPLNLNLTLPLSLHLCVNAVLFIELINTATGCCRLLLTGIESMALRANLYVDLLLRGTGYEFIATVAGNLCLVVGWMDTLSHDFHLFTFQFYSPVII